MIRISCTSCQTVLEIDDAFAGGVCRCRHCGTIQTVPAHLKGGDESAAHDPVDARPAPKTLYQTPSRAAETDTPLQSPSAVAGLSELASIVSSSGLSGGRLRAAPPRGPVAIARGNPIPLFAGAVAALLLAVGIVWFSMRTTPAGGIAQNPAAGAPGAVGVAQPGVVGIPIAGQTIIYLLDDGGGTSAYFSGGLQAIFTSISSLGPDRKFQIILWSAPAVAPAAYPASGPTFATKENLEAVRTRLQDATAFGQTDVEAALKLAMGQNPSEIVLATGKGWELDAPFVEQVMNLRGASSVKLDTISLGPAGGHTGLADLAAKTGGQYKEIASEGELRQYQE